jgi:hypothetical protein
VGEVGRAPLSDFESLGSCHGLVLQPGTIVVKPALPLFCTTNVRYSGCLALALQLAVACQNQADGPGCW